MANEKGERLVDPANGRRGVPGDGFDIGRRAAPSSQGEGIERIVPVISRKGAQGLAITLNWFPRAPIVKSCNTLSS
jgi:hypothetical protein